MTIVRTRAAALAAILLLVPAGAAVYASDPFVDDVVLFEPGASAGFGQEEMPAIVEGPPVGAGAVQGSLHVVSLGNGGRIVVGFTDTVICDGDGIDFTVFENAFHVGSPDGPLFAEVGIVAASQDGETFFEFPYDEQTFEGLAGNAAVYANPDNDIDPTDPVESGGDPFDLADVGLAWAAFVRIIDPGSAIDDPGNHVPPGIEGGFDLDAVAIVNECTPPPDTTLPPASTTTITTPSTSTTVSTTTSTTVPDGAVCGDGIAQDGEDCDLGGGWQTGRWCADDCTRVACGDPDHSGVATASDALFVLTAAVGTNECDRCVCDVDSAGEAVSASDALRLLQFAVEVPGIEIACPACDLSP